MKFFKKINRGLILSIVILLCLGCYIAANESKRSDDKKEITALCKNFFTDVSPLYTGEGDIEEVIEKYYSDDDKVVIPAIEAIENELLSRKLTVSELEMLNCSVSSVDSFTFKGDTAEVCVSYNLDYSGKSGSGSFSYSATLTFKEDSDGWKVYYTKLVFELGDIIDNEGGYKDGFIATDSFINM